MSTQELLNFEIIKKIYRNKGITRLELNKYYASLNENEAYIKIAVEKHLSSSRFTKSIEGYKLAKPRKVPPWKHLSFKNAE
jgi:hypothetical protein